MPDLTDTIEHQAYEIKPALSQNLGFAQLAGYLILLNKYDTSGNVWIPGFSYLPPPAVTIKPGTIALVSGPEGGVITYYVVDFTEAVGLVAAYTAYQISSLDLGGALESASFGGAF